MLFLFFSHVFTNKFYSWIQIFVFTRTALDSAQFPHRIYYKIEHYFKVRTLESLNNRVGT